jgi:hypothetical protein
MHSKCIFGLEFERRNSMKTVLEFGNDIHKIIEEKCSYCKRTDLHWCGYCIDTIYSEYIKNNKEIFQFESSGMINKLKEYKPTTINDVTII